MKRRLGKVLEGLFCLSAVLPAAAWVSFAVQTRNTFRLDEFQQGDSLFCLVLTALPIVAWFFLCCIRGRRGMDLPAVLFSLAACGWVLMLCSQWDDWARAVATESIGLLQQNRLRFTALGNLGLCLLPLLKVMADSLRKGGKA